jgi:spore maturation protein CgeB
MKVLYLGPNSGTSKHRANAIRRIGHNVRIVDPELFVPTGRLLSKLHWETGGVLCESDVLRGLLNEIDGETFDVTWVDGGRYVGPMVVQELKKRYGPIVNYNVDDPYGHRDRFSWSSYRRAVRYYDLVVVVRECNVPEAKKYGADKVLRVYRSADEVAHVPVSMTESEVNEWKTDVLFIGTGFPERGQFMAELLAAGVPLTIFGNGWHRLKEWPRIKDAWKRPGTTDDPDYVRAIQSARICLGLLSKENRDLHTTRTMEIPSIGSLFVAERTAEHRYLYDEGSEAFFWSNATECAALCNSLLVAEDNRQNVAYNGHKRFIRNGHVNEQLARQLFAEMNLG